MTADDELSRLDATGQAALVRTGQATPLELVEAAIGRIEAVNPTINAVIHERFERARAEATGPLPDGPLRGVPFLLKDLHAFSVGDPHHGGTRFLAEAGWIADRDDDVGAVEPAARQQADGQRQGVEVEERLVGRAAVQLAGFVLLCAQRRLQREARGHYFLLSDFWSVACCWTFWTAWRSSDRVAPVMR